VKSEQLLTANCSLKKGVIRVCGGHILILCGKGRVREEREGVFV
jgi:hypothetical protein